MPEGDTIFRAARTLNLALAGKTVTRFETALALLARVDDESPIRGRVIERVVAAGKHLIIEFSGDLALRTHMRMNGSWHIYRPGERWRARRSDMRVVIETADFVAVGFNIPVAEFHTSRSLARQADIRRIGPDLLGETFDMDEALRRMRERGTSEIANVLLNQRVLAGAGNVFKSEVLFLTGVNPFRLVADLTDEQLREIIALTRRLMQHNVDVESSGGRDTTGSLDPSKALWVYGHYGETCRRCQTPLQYAKQGPDARSTYWCSTCQR